MFGKRELHKNTMDCRVIVEFRDLQKKLRLGDGLGEFDEFADDVGLVIQCCH